MSLTEILVIGGMTIIGVIFFLVAYEYISQEGEEGIKAQIKAEADEISSIINRISKEKISYIRFCKKISLANISVVNNLLRYERDGFVFFNLIPGNVTEVELKNVVELCLVKKSDKIILTEKLPIYESDGFCMIEECRFDNPDCYGPASTCLGDGFCNENIGENCENSVDCVCPAGKVCCSLSPDSDTLGCSGISGLGEGEECFCDNQCSPGLKCNPVASGFNRYKKACCKPGTRWNGVECVFSSFKLLFIQMNQKIENLKEIAEQSKNYFTDITPLSKCKDRVDVIVEEEKICNVPDQNLVCEDDDWADLTLDRLRECAHSWGYYDYTRIIGVWPLSSLCNGVRGYTYLYSDVVVTSLSSRTPLTISHELGHTFGLCDEGYGNAECVDCMGGLCKYGGSYCCPPVNRDTCIYLHVSPCCPTLTGVCRGYECPNEPEGNSLMCSIDLCGRGCSYGSRFAPSSYKHLEKELNMYCG